MVMEQRGDGKCRGYYKRDGDIEQMAVHEFGDVAVSRSATEPLRAGA